MKGLTIVFDTENQYIQTTALNKPFSVAFDVENEYIQSTALNKPSRAPQGSARLEEVGR